MMPVELEDQLAELDKAKKAVRWLLDNPAGLVDMHGIAYWAQRVEDLRRDIQGRL